MISGWRTRLSMSIMLLLVSACGASGIEENKTPSSNPIGEVQLAGLVGDQIANVTQREASPAADGKAVNGVVSGTNDFAVRFFQAAIGESADNAVVGNNSLSTALLLTMAGTGGVTTDAFAGMLGVTEVDRAELHDAVNAIDLILESRADDGLDISTANKIFVQQGLPLRDEFLDIAVGSYGAPVTAVDFATAADEVVEIVNQWVSEQTDGFIDKLASEYDPNTVVVLVNAMYLKARWAVQFHRLDQTLPFTTSTGEVVNVMAMGHAEYLPINTDHEDFVAVELPYVGGHLSLVVIQPIDLVAFEANLTAEQLEEITDGLAESGVHLTMPIWSTKTTIEALDPLHTIGLPDAYDFSTMIEGGESGYWIDGVNHVARIEVDETGTTAGAATEVVIEASHGPTVIIDRPFFYMIRDRGSGAILFLGHVINPSQNS